MAEVEVALEYLTDWNRRISPEDGCDISDEAVEILLEEAGTDRNGEID